MLFPYYYYAISLFWKLFGNWTRGLGGANPSSTCKIFAWINFCCPRATATYNDNVNYNKGNNSGNNSKNNMGNNKGSSSGNNNCNNNRGNARVNKDAIKAK